MSISIIIYGINNVCICITTISMSNRPCQRNSHRIPSLRTATLPLESLLLLQQHQTFTDSFRGKAKNFERILLSPYFHHIIGNVLVHDTKLALILAMRHMFRISKQMHQNRHTILHVSL